MVSRTLLSFVAHMMPCLKDANCLVYSFGITLYEVYSRRDPYQGEDLLSTLQKVADPTIQYRPSVPQECPSCIKSVMLDCLADNQDVRPSFQALDLQFKELDAQRVEPDHMDGSILLHRRPHASYDRDALPPQMIEVVKNGYTPQPTIHEHAAVVLCEIVDFDRLCQELPPFKVANFLDRLYGSIEKISMEQGIFEIETAVHSWMGVVNLYDEQSEDYSQRLFTFAVQAVNTAQQTFLDAENPSLGRAKIKVGLHTGPVRVEAACDYHDTQRTRCSLFGATINTLVLLTEQSLPNRIQCSLQMARLFKEQVQDCPLSPRQWDARDVAKMGGGGRMDVATISKMDTFWVNEHVPEAPLVAGSPKEVKGSAEGMAETV